MAVSEETYKGYLRILEAELVPATGCTEPIAIAYGAAVARAALGRIPDRVSIQVSGNILKNVKSVIVPNTNGMKGIKAAVSAGIIAGREDARLEVISGISSDDIIRIHDYCLNTPIDVKCMETSHQLDILVTLFYLENYAMVRIVDSHTNIVLLKTDKYTTIDNPVGDNNLQADDDDGDANLLNMPDIFEFANSVDISHVREMIDRQISYNMAIADAGLKGDYGANIGRVILDMYGDGVKSRARAYAAAGSDARMDGCDMPVVIVSGSGNQGMTASIPVIIYAQELNVPKDKLYRALVLSSLTTIHQKMSIGRLSSFCGAVSAGCGAGAGVAYINGGDYDTIAHTIVNALAILSGMVCDGAKASCAAKIGAAVDAGILGYYMYKNGQQFLGGDGIISKGVDNTILNVGRMARDGMRETDKEIIRIMTGE